MVYSMKNISVGLLLLASGLAHAATTCPPGERKYYVASEWVVIERIPGQPPAKRVETAVVCSNQGEHLSEAGLKRLTGRLLGKGMADKFMVTLISAMPLSD